MNSLSKSVKSENQKEIDRQHQRDKKKRRVAESRKLQQQKRLVRNEILLLCNFYFKISICK